MEENLIYILVASTTARVGTILLMIFGVQILVSLHRYNTRLAAYYDARADALQLLGKNDPRLLGELIHSLSPETLDFGKDPRTPAAEAVELLKNIRLVAK